MNHNPAFSANAAAADASERFIERLESAALQLFYHYCNGPKWCNAGYFDPDYIMLDSAIGEDGRERSASANSNLSDNTDTGIDFQPSISTLGVDSVFGDNNEGRTSPQTAMLQKRRRSSLKPPTIAPDTTPPPSNSNWHGVTTSKRTVIKIDLHDNNLAGILPGGVGCGRFPAEMRVPGKEEEEVVLKNLKVLILFQNKLTGLIPSSYSKLSKLQHLDLSHNLLSGDLPHSMFTIVTLKRLHLENNFTLTGVISENIGTLVNLESFTASNNRLTGCLPESIVNCVKLRELSLHHNRMVGVIPVVCLGGMGGLRKVYLSDNHFDPPARDVLDGIERREERRGLWQLMPQKGEGDGSDDEGDEMDE